MKYYNEHERAPKFIAIWLCGIIVVASIVLWLIRTFL